MLSMITLRLEDHIIEDIIMGLHKYIVYLEEENKGIDEPDSDHFERMKNCKLILTELVI